MSFQYPDESVTVRWTSRSGARVIVIVAAGMPDVESLVARPVRVSGFAWAAVFAGNASRTKLAETAMKLVAFIIILISHYTIGPRVPHYQTDREKVSILYHRDCMDLELSQVRRMEFPSLHLMGSILPAIKSRFLPESGERPDRDKRMVRTAFGDSELKSENGSQTVS